MHTTGSTIVDAAPPAPTTSTTSPRLAELVIHLTDCDPRLAVAAVDAASGAALVDTDDRLATVARALISVRRTIDLREPKRPA